MVVLDSFAVVKLGLVAGDAESSGVGRGTRSVNVKAGHPLTTKMGVGGAETRQQASWLPWIMPSQGNVVAVAESGHASAVAFEKGEETPGGSLPERRSVLLLGSSATDYASSGWAMFDEAIRWSAHAEGTQADVAARGAEARPAKGPAEVLTGGDGIILMVVGGYPLSAAESDYALRMVGMGFEVQTVKAIHSQASDANLKKLVFISSTSSEGDVNVKFQLSETPVLIQSSDLGNEMKMTGSGTNVDQGTQSGATSALVTQSSHPITAPLSGTVALSSASGNLSWGVGVAPDVQHVLGLSPPGSASNYPLLVYETAM